MRVAITGASGFVGRYVLRELQSRDLDIVATSRSPNHRIAESGRTEIVRLNIAHDLPDPYGLLGRPDVLFHLAWDGLPNYQSTEHVRTELPAQLRFLKTCIASGLKRLVVTGTCFEYGKTSGEISEDLPTHPCTQYGAAKDSLRRQLEEWRTECNFQLAWVRLFYLYGSGQAQNSLYSMLTGAIARGDTKFDMSGGEQVRDFLHIQKAAQAITDIGLLPTDVGTINVCSGIPTSVRQLVEGWINEKNSGITMNLGRLPYAAFEPMSFWGSRAKLHKLLGDL